MNSKTPLEDHIVVRSTILPLATFSSAATFPNPTKKYILAPKKNTEETNDLSLFINHYALKTNNEAIITSKSHINNLEPWEETIPMFTSSFNGKLTGFISLNPDISEPTFLHDPPQDPWIPNILILSSGLDRQKISELWDSIALTTLEDDIVSCLQVIDKNIERANLISGKERNQDRYPIVRLKDTNNPIPLRSLGDGILRAFGIALALVNVRDGILLVDEFESGLHYSVQLDLWRLIFQTARRLNIQVFATTHSWDCVEAFQKAAEEDQGEEAMLIRLERSNGDIKAVLFDERRLRIATREQIEVR